MSEHEIDRLLRESRRGSVLLGAILDDLSEGVLATDSNGRLLFANSVAREILGMSEDRVQSIDKPHGLPEPFGDPDLREMIRRCAEEGGRLETITDKEGVPLQVRLRSVKRSDDHGNDVLVFTRPLPDVWLFADNQWRFPFFVAHELKISLAAVVGSAQALGDEEDPKAKLRLLELMEEEVRRAWDLSETFLRLAGVEYD